MSKPVLFFVSFPFLHNFRGNQTERNQLLLKWRTVRGNARSSWGRQSGEWSAYGDVVCVFVHACVLPSSAHRTCHICEQHFTVRDFVLTHLGELSRTLKEYQHYVTDITTQVRPQEQYVRARVCAFACEAVV